MEWRGENTWNGFYYYYHLLNIHSCPGGYPNHPLHSMMVHHRAIESSYLGASLLSRPNQSIETTTRVENQESKYFGRFLSSLGSYLDYKISRWTHFDLLLEDGHSSNQYALLWSVGIMILCVDNDQTIDRLLWWTFKRRILIPWMIPTWGNSPLDLCLCSALQKPVPHSLGDNTTHKRRPSMTSEERTISGSTIQNILKSGRISIERATGGSMVLIIELIMFASSSSSFGYN